LSGAETRNSRALSPPQWMRILPIRRKDLMSNSSGSQISTMSEMIDVVRIRRLGRHRLEIEFSNGTVGERDFAFLKHDRGPMVEPLKDAAYFDRVFIEDGALTWPNGYDWDPIALHDEMREAGELRPAGDAAE
jgi:hypothetical protein